MLYKAIPYEDYEPNDPNVPDYFGISEASWNEFRPTPGVVFYEEPTLDMIVDLLTNEEPWGPNGDEPLDGELAKDLVGTISGYIDAYLGVVDDS